MRMGVVLVRLSVRGPARVAHAERPFEVMLAELRLEVGKLPLGAHDVDAFAVDDRNARTVVPAILELLQPADQNGNDVTVAYVAHDSAHGYLKVMSNE